MGHRRQLATYKSNAPKVILTAADEQAHRTSKKVNSVKIEKTSSKPVSSTSVGESAARPSTNRTGASSNSGASTSVHLGATAAQLRSMESSIASSPIVDVAKVAEIKQAISEGRFQVNSGIVADRLIETARELLGAGAH